MAILLVLATDGRTGLIRANRLSIGETFVPAANFGDVGAVCYTEVGSTTVRDNVPLHMVEYGIVVSLSVVTVDKEEPAHEHR
jgi:hypothetical protein